MLSPKKTLTQCMYLGIEVGPEDTLEICNRKIEEKLSQKGSRKKEMTEAAATASAGNKENQ